MKLNKNFEQAVFVLLILALQIDHRPIKSYQLSSILEVSDSYLKKILRQLVVAGFIKSIASKDGGFVLARSVEELSLADVYRVFVGNVRTQSLGLANKIFKNDSHVRSRQQLVEDTLERANSAFVSELEAVKLSDLLEDGAYENGAIDWCEY